MYTHIFKYRNSTQKCPAELEIHLSITINYINLCLLLWSILADKVFDLLSGIAGTIMHNSDNFFHPRQSMWPTLIYGHLLQCG